MRVAYLVAHSFSRLGRTRPNPQQLEPDSLASLAAEAAFPATSGPVSRCKTSPLLTADRRFGSASATRALPAVRPLRAFDGVPSCLIESSRAAKRCSARRACVLFPARVFHPLQGLPLSETCRVSATPSTPVLGGSRQHHGFTASIRRDGGF